MLVQCACAGLIHFQQNLGCKPATYTISYNSEDPGTQVHAALQSTVHAHGNPVRVCSQRSVPCRWSALRSQSCQFLAPRWG